MDIPDRFNIENVPYFSSLHYPYYCTEASLQMVYEFFCNGDGLDQDIIEDLGGRTYEGYKEYHDIGAANMLKNIGFTITQVDGVDKGKKTDGTDLFEKVKIKLYTCKMPIIIRLIGKKSGWNHTVVATGYDGDKLIVNDPDTKAGDTMQFPSKQFGITSYMIVHRPEKCTVFEK
jgi:hypothetical protein